MTTREKRGMENTLKANSYKVGDTAIKTGIIKSVQDIETRFGVKTTLSFENQEDDEIYSIFLNAKSQNSLIEAYGTDDVKWKGKHISVIAEKDETYDKVMLVVVPIK